MTRGNALLISEVPSARWDVAIALLEEGRLSVTIDCEPTLTVRRTTKGLRADGRVYVSVYTSLSAPAITQEVADHDVREGLRHLNALLDADPRLPSLIDQHGLCVEYLADYGMGSALVGKVAEDGTVTLVI